MKPVSWLIVLLASSAIIAAGGHRAEAFHLGGVAHCDGCHTMHNSLGGQAAVSGFPQFTAGPYLLKAADQSSACLNCHEGQAPGGATDYHVTTAASAMPDGVPPMQLTPGGDFGWLKKTYNWVSGEGGADTSSGERHGHNIVAADFGYLEDTTIQTSPGGSYPSSSLSCISCHDPHGRYRITNPGVIATIGKPIKASGSYGDLPDASAAVGVFRLLGGLGYKPKSAPADAPSFNYQAFFAVAPQDYNRSEAASDTRVAYGKGTSLWCANCHFEIHSMFGGYEHATDVVMISEIRNNYNSYRKSGDLTGVPATAYTSLVPFQMDGTTDLTTLANAVSSTAGPASADRVTCFSCHRPHASGWDSIGRWNFKTTFIVYDGLWPGASSPPDYAQGRSAGETRQAYFDRPPDRFATYQRSLCNKCHAKD